jgi:hypothetical protein
MSTMSVSVVLCLSIHVARTLVRTSLAIHFVMTMALCLDFVIRQTTKPSETQMSRTTTSSGMEEARRGRGTGQHRDCARHGLDPACLSC